MQALIRSKSAGITGGGGTAGAGPGRDLLYLQLAAPCLESPWLPELVSGPEVAGMALSAKNTFFFPVLQFFLFFPNFFFVRRIFLFTMNIFVLRRNFKMNFPKDKNFKIFF